MKYKVSNLLRKICNTLESSKLSDYYDDKPYNHENVNYLLYSNKDGKYSWRPLQIINPLIYVDLVNVITKESNWENIKNKFKEFQSNPNIKCMSIPIISTSKKKDKAEQIISWWEQIEQESLKLALEFNYVIHTDITNCYGSIYTHTIPWALHGKEKAKSKKKKDLLGNKIDKCFQNMNYGQTNGIPQGSVLSDFVSEIILGYIDSELSKAVNANGISEYKILRYRDDYRIFTKELNVGEKILKLLSEILLEFNFKLNDKKTYIENDLIISAVKKDKLEYLGINKTYSSIQKELLILYKFAKNYPNSGSLTRWLNNLYNKIIKDESKTLKNENKKVLISILTEIMYKNPRVISTCVAIISIIIKDLNKSNKLELINSIYNKFSTIPNIGLLEIWLQRLTYTIDPQYDFYDGLCKKVQEKESIIWNIEWLQDGSLKNIIKETDFIQREELNKLGKIINEDEFDIFYY
jgi:RNA-directed DNA polymerase